MESRLNLECDRCKHFERDAIVESGSESDRICYRQVDGTPKVCGGTREVVWDDGGPGWTMR